MSFVNYFSAIGSSNYKYRNAAERCFWVDLKFVENLQINSHDEENRYCVLCGRDYCESYT